MRWEVALVDTEGDRTVVATDVATEELWSYIATGCETEPAYKGRRRPAVLVSRMHLADESWKARVEQLVDVAHGTDKNGKPTIRRKLRYGKMSMKDWDRMVQMNKWRPKPKAKAQLLAESRAVVSCRNGDDLCACLILDTTCRLEGENQVPSFRKDD